jgi:uncharacterized protein YlzI (FlbEa/FlbD family)
MKRVKLENEDNGATIYLNPEYIVAITSNSQTHSGARITMVAGEPWNAKETVDQVLEKIDALDGDYTDNVGVVP